MDGKPPCFKIDCESNIKPNEMRVDLKRSDGKQSTIEKTLKMTILFFNLFYSTTEISTAFCERDKFNKDH